MYYVVHYGYENMDRPPIKSGFKTSCQAYRWAKKNLKGNIYVYGEQKDSKIKYDYEVKRKFNNFYERR